MKIKLYFDKGNLGILAVAMIFAAVLFWKIGFSVWALPVFGALCTIFMLYRLYAAVSGLKGNG